MKLSFVGQGAYFRTTALSQPLNGIKPVFVEFKIGDDPDKLASDLKKLKSDLIIVFKPESIPNGVLKQLPGIKIGWFTEPIPKSQSFLGSISSTKQSRDLRRRLSYLKGVDFSQFDRFISYDPTITHTLSKFVDVWRSYPLPVDDKFFVDAHISTARNPKFGFFGRPTSHRDKYILPALHENEILYVAHGATGSTLSYLLGEINVGLNLHNENYPNFENRVPLHLACGHLLISDPLNPTHGLEPGIDFIQTQTPESFWEQLRLVRDDYESFHLMRLRGRLKAEYFRASKIYSEILAAV